MKNHTISTAITSPVVLGSRQYGALLTITSTGSVEPSRYYANAISGGASLSAVSLQNAGTLVGGSSGGLLVGGAGISLASVAVITNKGAIVGGTNYFRGVGGAGISLAAEGTVHNTGTIAGGTSYGSGGGVGVYLSSAGTLTNSGTIAGGALEFSAGAGGVGVVLGGNRNNGYGSVSNSGSISGGNGIGYSGMYAVGESNGGVGIDVQFYGSVTNTGRVSGGGGNPAYNIAGNGGIGIVLEVGGRLANHGTVVGGNGGGSYASSGGAGGAGVSGSGDLTNTGTIIGGNGGSGSAGFHGSSGAGIYLKGGSLVAKAGLIQGGQAYGYPQADAVKFGELSSTLVVYGAARFSGDIAANVAAQDTLVLAGKEGTLSGLGTTVNGFNDYTENANSDWTLNGALTGNGNFLLEGSDVLQLNGASVLQSIDFSLYASSTVILGSPSAVTSAFGMFGQGDTIQLLGITAHSLSYANGTLTLLGGSDHAVDKLFFSGTYTAADFKLQAITGGTEVLYAGTAANHVPGHFGAPEFGGHVASPGIALGADSWLAAWHGLLR